MTRTWWITVIFSTGGVLLSGEPVAGLAARSCRHSWGIVLFPFASTLAKPAVDLDISDTKQS